MYFKPAGGSKSPHTEDVDVNNNNFVDDGATLAGAAASSGERSTVANDTVQTYMDPSPVTAVSNSMVDANLDPAGAKLMKMPENTRLQWGLTLALIKKQMLLNQRDNTNSQKCTFLSPCLRGT